MFWKPKKQPTLVYVYFSRSPLDRWQSVVVYDAWGNPSVRDIDVMCKARHRMFADGTGERAYGWTFKSGPAVRFAEQAEMAA